ncbi:DNA repair protein [Micromonospora craterilacus]|uniref:DNA repair protein n=1 Tax=Micromonospora craterilacus TaxID=1655439 RepID=A0A2W2EJN5_9ACTN|nr:DNA repair protein [Micromonospora craterilacus]PZG22871.1 DNA repair protein [Micromonospora craterilacus]
MPNQPNDRYQQDIERIWHGRTAAGRFPAQPPYRGHRTDVGALSWHALNELPAGTFARSHLNTL